MIMFDVIKKGVLAGIGAAVVTKEVAEKALEDLVAKGRLTSTEAKDAAERIVAEGRREYESTCGNLQDAFDAMLRKAHVATQAELAQLRVRVEQLELAATVPAANAPEGQ